MKQTRYARILVTTPEPTVRPPSRMAKRRLSSMAIGDVRATTRPTTLTLSPGMHISTPVGQGHVARHVRGAEVELRAVAGEERRMPAAFFLAQDVDAGLELRVRRDRTRLGEHLAAFKIGALDAAEQHADVVASRAEIQRLVEHFDAGDDVVLRAPSSGRRFRLRRRPCTCRARYGRCPPYRGP